MQAYWHHPSNTGLLHKVMFLSVILSTTWHNYCCSLGILLYLKY